MEKFTEEERDEQLALYECLKDAQTELECTIERMKGKYAVLKRGIQNIAPQVQALKDLVCSEEEFKKYMRLQQQIWSLRRFINQVKDDKLDFEENDTRMNSANRLIQDADREIVRLLDEYTKENK